MYATLRPLYLPAAGHRLPTRSASPEWARVNYIYKLGHAYAVLEKLGGLIFTLRLRRDMHDKFVAAADPCRSIYKRIDRSFALSGVEV